MANITFKIIPARSESDMTAIKNLFTAYSESLKIHNITLEFQSFSQEFASLPGKYERPHGELLLAVNQTGNPIGCVGIRPLSLANVPKCCELKRLYVTLEGRGTGAGKALANEALRISRELGYENMRLDTLLTMRPAITLYKQLGFKVCERYYDTPFETLCFAKDLTV